MIRRILFVAAFAAGLPSFPQAAFPQLVVVEDDEDDGVIEVAQAGEQPAENPPAAAKPAQETKETARLAALKKLMYDRRSAAMLRAWSEPLDKKAEDGGAAKPQADSAKPAEGAAGEQPATGKPAESAKPGDEKAAADAKAAAEKAAAEKVAAEKAAAEAKALELEMKTLQRNVTLGRWGEVKSYLAGIPQIEGKEGYAQMLRSLASPPPPDPNIGGRAQNAGIQDQHVFALDDVIGLAAACPHKRERQTVEQLAPMLMLAVQSGVLPQTVISRFEREAARPEGEAILTRTQCAWLLVATNQTGEIEPFLPSFETATAGKDAESLILLARCRAAKYEKDKKPETIESAWKSLQPVLTMSEAKDTDRTEALKMTIALVPRIREGLGQAWLEESFALEPELGMKIIAASGGAAANTLIRNFQNPSERLRDLKVQKTVVESLLSKTPERADQWQDMLRVMASAWLREAELTRQFDRSTMYGPRMQRDMFGNYFYMDEDGNMMSMQRGNNELRPIGSADMLDTAPSDAWQARLEESLRPKFLALHAQLYLKVAEDERAYPFIERLAGSHPELARDLVHEFIRVWTRNHDMNANNRYTNPYMWMYGFEMRANGIPLTRSKQERNLEELAAWVRRVRALPVKDLDESLFAKAFTACHSVAEVYRIEAIEKVLGSMDSLDSKTLAQLVQQMRTNLAGIWRIPAQQEQQKTQRKQKDIEAEVLRGYAVANAVVTDGLARHPDDWRLQLAQASLSMDQNTYQHEIAPSSKFSEQRLAAIDQFRKAAELYAKQVPTLPEAEQEATAFERWFYAGLGGSDVGQIDHKTTPDPRQPPLIREAILALPGEAAEKHMSMFANSLFTRMSALKPNVKFRYLSAGFEIVGDHKQAREARRVYDYYKDLVTEIKLVARVDGSNKVGHGQPFGVFVELLHTREIERESGGFAKYLQNQTSMMYAWNYGRPLENYRDKFEESVRAALDEHFEVRSVTFQEKDVHSRAASEYGWRTTPYAYLLLKAKGPQVDKLPSLKMDFDFLDTSGYAVLPVVSSPVPVDAAPDRPDRRPYEKLKVVETLDERQAKEGKLVLEVKATARGLVPGLDELLDVRSSDFEVTSTDDQGALVSRFDPESGEPAVISERTWMITYAGRKDLAALPTTFHFPEPKVETNETSYMRYEDADLKSVALTVSLEQKYGEVRARWPWVVAAIVPVLIAGGLGWRAWSRRKGVAGAEGPVLPERLTAFNVLALLRRVEENNGFDDGRKRELADNIASLERFYFSGTDGQQPPDLRKLAERWVAPRR